MRIPNSHRRGDFGINMTPMIDVVFQLLIFFLVSSHLAKQETQLPLPLPVASSSQRPEDEEGPRLTINVLADGQLIVAGRHVALTELPERLQNAVATEGKQLEVRIRCDRGVKYERVQPILLSCARAGIWKTSFAVYGDKSVAP